MTILSKALLPLSVATFAVVAWACSSAVPRADFTEDGGAHLPDVIPDDDGNVAQGDAAAAKPPFDPTDEPVTCATSPCAVEIVAGENHFCTRMSDGTVRCWGGSAGDAGVVAAPQIAQATQLSAGGSTTCALVADGGVDCWGGNDEGQLGLDAVTPIVDGDPHEAPSKVALAGAAQRVDVGPSSACAVLASGEVWCWGDNAHEQLARATPTEIGVPGKAELGDLSIARTAAGTYTGFALTTEGDLVSWGAVGGSEGSVGGRISSVNPDPRPFSLGLTPVTSFSVSSTTIVTQPAPDPPRGIGHACAIANGEVYCWGDTLTGAIGAGLPTSVATPVRAAIASLSAWARQVVAAGDLTCLRLTDGTVECAGDNARGELATPTSDAFSFVFRPATAFTGHAVQLAASSKAICALVQGGSVVCWGSNESSELGQGGSDTDPHITPVAVLF
jgi:alpha-tubulin suppressor-like RCC1 family protein